MKIDLLICEIGSTTTVANAFNGIGSSVPKYIGQGVSPTTVDQSDVSIGMNNAIEDLRNKLGADKIEYNEMFATSSAAGGLKMTVHGLVYEMTANAAHEAAIGAGANIHLVTSGKLRRTDLRKVSDIKPNIILVAGGVDYGERDTALYNIERLLELDLDVPIIYAGNIENHEEIIYIFEEKGKLEYLRIVDNVYPKIDELNVEPTRALIHDTFEEHIIHAEGMHKIKELVNGKIIPTPGAVMESSKLLQKELGDLITIDVGGATTDLHSVAEGSEAINRILVSPEPKAKRSVEGDLGVYVNMENVYNLTGKDELLKLFKEDELEVLLKNYKPIPTSEKEFELVNEFVKTCVYHAIDRHAGSLKMMYMPGKNTKVAYGKDLTEVKYIIGTGGALTRLPGAKSILENIHRQNKVNKLYPNKEAKVLLDNDYIMASLGVLSKKYPEDALKLLERSLKLEDLKCTQN